jgi:putative glutamine transport system permease protein
MLDFSVLTGHFDLYLRGLGNTLAASVITLIASLIWGTVLAVMRIIRVRILNILATAYVEFIRNIPFVLVVFVFYYGAASFNINLNGFVAGAIGLTVYTSAFIAETVRAGILSIAKGQMEAARSTGLSYLQSMRYIVLPQAMRVVLPPLGNQFLNLIKNTSVLGLIAGFDLMYYGDLIQSDTFQTFTVYFFVALFYLVLTVPLSFGVKYLERRFVVAP